MKRLKTILLVITILALSLSSFNAYADEFATEHFEADLISDGKLIPVTTNTPPVVQPQGINENLYDAVYYGLEHLQERIDVRSLGLSLAKHQDVEDIRDTYSAVVNENPILFYIGAGFSVDYNIYTGAVSHIVPTYMDNAKENKAVFEQKTAEILSKTIREGMTDEEKLLSLHDYIVHNCEYNYGQQTMDDHTAYGIIVKELGVCQSYALAYNYLLSLVGVESKFCISEYLYDENDNIVGGMGHGWSTVKLNDNWYHVDITWDDPNFGSDELNSKGFVIHDFFLLSDETLASFPGGEHYDWVVGVECTDKSYESGMPYHEDDTKHVDTNNEHHFTGFYPMYQFIYNENDGLFYSQVEPSSLNVYFKTSFDGSDLDFIPPTEYEAAVGLPVGVSAYAPINLTDKRMTFASLNNMSNTYLTFENTIGNDIDGTMLIALYNNDKQLVSCEIKSITIPAETTAIKIAPITADDAATGKILIWDTDTQTEILNIAVEL